jgi:hypothetical protein
MNEQWLQEYALLALRINKVMQVHTELPYVDGYYGPKEWKATVDSEPELPAADLMKAARALADALTAQNFEQGRATHLAKQVVAMETVCRKLGGEPLSLEEEINGYFGIRPAWIPEAQFDQALAMYDVTLPGKGPLATRLHEWRQQYLLSPKHTELFLTIAEHILAEIRRRTEAFLDLPAGESVEIHTVSDKPFGAATFYQGNYRTLVEINTDQAISVLALVDDLCHEGYPGHHTEFVLKEHHLYRKLGYIEQAVPIVLSPPCLVSEGIATHACDLIFAPGELEQWLTEHIYRQLGLHPDVVDLTTLRTAGDLLNGVWCNAVFMLREGRPKMEVQDYLAKYMQPVGIVDHLLLPFHDVYVCTYYYGKQLLEPWLQGPGRREAFRHFLTEQVYPTDLAQHP